MSTDPKTSAWDYGTPQQATEVVEACIRESLGVSFGVTFELAATGSRVHISNLAAAIVHDLVTTGAMVPTISDFPPPERIA